VTNEELLSTYADFVDGKDFVPIIMGTLGGFGRKALSVLRLLGIRISELTFDNREFFYLRQRLPIMVCKGNALCTRGSLPVLD
jgi:hypothetical protein